MYTLIDHVEFERLYTDSEAVWNAIDEAQAEIVRQGEEIARLRALVLEYAKDGMERRLSQLVFMAKIKGLNEYQKTEKTFLESQLQLLNNKKGNG